MAKSKYGVAPEIEVHTVEDAFLAVRNALENKMRNDPKELLPKAWLNEEEIIKVIHEEQQKYRERKEREENGKRRTECGANESGMQDLPGGDGKTPQQKAG